MRKIWESHRHGNSPDGLSGSIGIKRSLHNLPQSSRKGIDLKRKQESSSSEMDT